MLARMPNRIWQEWIAYDEEEPFGEKRADLRMGILASTIANCTARHRGMRAFKPEQFIPKFSRRPVHRTPEELLNKVRWINRLFGGRVISRSAGASQSELNGSHD